MPPSAAPSLSASSRNGCRLFFRFLAHLIAAGTAAVAVFAMLQVRESLEEEPTFDGETLTMPILLCMPTTTNDMTRDEGNVFANATAPILDTIAQDQGKDVCHSMKYLVHSVTFALGLAALALLIFILVDALARTGCGGPFNASMSAGMALFSTFILFQAAASAGALLSEMDYWKDYYQDLQEGSDWTLIHQGEVRPVQDVTVYGHNSRILPLAVLALLLSTFIMVLEVFAVMCCCGGSSDRGNKDREDTAAAYDEENDVLGDLKLNPSLPPAVASPSSHNTFPSPSSLSDDEEEITTTTKNDKNSCQFSLPSWSSFVGAGGGLRENLAE